MGKRICIKSIVINLIPMLFIVSCEIPQKVQNQAIGVGVKAVANEVVEQLTPVYDFIRTPVELCYFTETDNIECVLTGCKVDCTRQTTVDELMEESPFVIPSKTASLILNSVKEFCKRNNCEEIVARYSSGKILLE